MGKQSFWTSPYVGTRRASLLRRVVASCSGIRRRMFIGRWRRMLGKIIPACPWRERQETAEAIWEVPQNAEALLILLRVSYS